LTLWTFKAEITNKTIDSDFIFICKEKRMPLGGQTEGTSVTPDNAEYAEQ